MIEKKLGKIKAVKFGRGGYNDMQFGLFLTLGDGSWGVGASGKHVSMDMSVERTKTTQWTELERSNEYAEEAKDLSRLLNQANVDSVEKLKGIAIEATFDGQMLKSWRILEEVL